QAVLWCQGIDDGLFDYNGYWPDGMFSLYLPSAGGAYAYRNFPDFAALQAAGIEKHGALLAGPILATGLIGPNSYEAQLAPQDATLAAGSLAIDAGVLLPNINDDFTGGGPDLGAYEKGCVAQS